MALAFNRTIESPGVEIREIDLSLYAGLPVGTNVMALGFTQQGPIDELLNITSISEFEQIYGKPKNAAERYFYHTARQILLKNGNLVASRLPYGEDDGEGYGSEYSVLAYPLAPIALSGGSLTSVSAVSSYVLGEPKQMILDEHEYTRLSQGNFIWTGEVSALATDCSEFTDFYSLSTAGLIVLNKNRVATNEYMESTYITFADNSKVGYGTDYDCITGFKTKINDLDVCDFFPIRESSLNFELTGTYKASRGSTSEIIESIPSYDLTPSKFNNTFVLGVIKLRKSIYNNQGVTQITLDQILTESFVGSLDMYREEVPLRGATPETFFLEDIVNRDSNSIQMIVNPLISQSDWTKGTDNLGNDTTKNVRVDDTAMNGYTLGSYVPNYTRNKAKEIGNLSAKIERALRLAENIDYVPLDIVAEGGLGTIGAFIKVANEIKTNGTTSQFYDLYRNWDGGYYEDIYLPGILETDANTPVLSNVALITPEFGPNDVGGRDSFIANEYQGIFSLFHEFCEFTRRPGTLFIADPLRHIFVQGNKVIGECRLWDENESKMVDANFPQHIYWPLRNLYAEVSTSYACTYANWVKVLDSESNSQTWLPFSGFEAGIMCDVDRNTFPWFAPAGLNRGRVSGITQIGYNTTQKQRDLLYRHSLNPVVFFPQDGFVVWGQKTLLKTPSAFDRINVRRLFLVLEKATVATSRYFVFEPNTIFTRTRLVDTIKPIFERAKNNEGLYDYMIVCDERNNTPDTIDRNELIVDIYLKPVRTAEFILISFIATRTGQDFSELV